MKIKNIRMGTAETIGEQQTGKEAMAVLTIKDYTLIEKIVEKLEKIGFNIAWTTSIIEKTSPAKIAIVFKNNFGEEAIGTEITELTRFNTYVNLNIIEI